MVSVELDTSLLPLLSETLQDRDNVEIVSGDILKTDIPGLVRGEIQGLNALACANLPYNITTPVITALLEANCFSAITVMIQREVARRICSARAPAITAPFRCTASITPAASCFLTFRPTALSLRPRSPPPSCA